MSRRERERAERIAWILDHALEVVVAEGEDALTTTRLAEKVGYTVGAFYRYFDCKAALLEALQRRTAERLYGMFFTLLAPARAELAARFERRSKRIGALAELMLLPRVYAVVARAQPEAFTLAALLTTRERAWMSDAEGARMRELVVPPIGEVIALFVAAEQLGALEPGEPAARLMVYWLGIHAILASAPLAQLHPELFDLDRLLALHVESLLRGWGAARRDLSLARETVAAIALEAPPPAPAAAAR